jgi:hypothetical protein
MTTTHGPSVASNENRHTGIAIALMRGSRRRHPNLGQRGDSIGELVAETRRLS